MAEPRRSTTRPSPEEVMYNRKDVAKRGPAGTRPRRREQDGPRAKPSTGAHSDFLLGSPRLGRKCVVRAIPTGRRHASTTTPGYVPPGWPTRRHQPSVRRDRGEPPSTPGAACPPAHLYAPGPALRGSEHRRRPTAQPRPAHSEREYPARPDAVRARPEARPAVRLARKGITTRGQRHKRPKNYAAPPTEDRCLLRGWQP